MTDNTCYSTGELAQACGVTVRTVQHYDNKGLLAPTARTDGGRRVYSQADAERLRFILMLKSLGLGLSQIRGVLESPNREKILITLLDEQRSRLQGEVDVRNAQLAAIESLHSDIVLFGRVRTMTESGMVTRMRDKKAWRRWAATMIVVGVFMDAAWIGTLVLGILTGIWWPFPLALVFVATTAFCMVAHYNAHLTCLCPVCDAEFRPRRGSFFVSRHTPRTRLLTCPCCHEKDWCVERYHADALDIAPGTCVPGTCQCEADSKDGACRQHVGGGSR